MAQQIRYYKQDGTEYSFSKEAKIKITQTSNADMNIGLPDKLTAVEWLFNQIPLEWTIKGSAKKIFEQAKQMEKEQIMKAVYDSMGTNFDPNWGRAEMYYNETYNK
jgi:hypothetical protein